MKHHILVVEDQATLLRGFLRSLEQVEGFRATGCATVDQAVGILESDPPDLLITDINLPGRYGLELLGELDARRLAIPVIVVTAYRAVYQSQIPDHHELTVLEKPVPMSELTALAQEKLRQSPQQRRTFQLTDYLQLAELARRSAVLTIETEAGTSGTVEIVDGAIWSARFGDLAAGAALETLLEESPKISASPLDREPSRRNVWSTSSQLLLERAKRQDEQGNAEGDESVSILEEAADPTREAFATAFNQGVRAGVQGDLETAAAAFKQALELRPEDSRARFNLDRVTRQLDQRQPDRP
ncbi:MAG: response regulator [bacterium]|nr:response regulator [bacterium]